MHRGESLIPPPGFTNPLLILPGTSPLPLPRPALPAIELFRTYTNDSFSPLPQKSLVKVPIFGSSLSTLEGFIEKQSFNWKDLDSQRSLRIQHWLMGN
jgi:hypothetical protein